MKVKDCKIGMKLKRIGDTVGDCKQGMIYTIKDLIPKCYSSDTDGVEFKELEGAYVLNKFELANKFKVGDRVLINFGDVNHKAEIISITNESYHDKYEIKIFKGWDGKDFILRVKEEDLSFSKKKDEFEVDDEVIDIYSGKGKIIFVADEEDGYDNKYAVHFGFGEGHYYSFAQEKDLSPAKDKYNLEVGDKFKSRTGDIYKIVYVDYNDFYEVKEYYCKMDNGPRKGVSRLFHTNHIDEIIYDKEAE